MIKTYISAEKNPAQLYASIGDWIISKSIHEKLGMPVTAEPGDVWFVSEDGFAQIRPMENHRFHLRYLYGQNDVARKELARHAISEAKTANAELVYINDRSTETIWKSLGFKETKRKNTKFSRWEKQL